MGLDRATAHFPAGVCRVSGQAELAPSRVLVHGVQAELCIPPLGA